MKTISGNAVRVGNYRHSPTTPSSMGTVLAVFLGISGAITFDLMGKLPLNELVCVVFAPFVIGGITTGEGGRRIWLLVLFTFLWMAGIGLADVVNGSLGVTTIKAIARSVTFFASTVVLYRFLREGGERLFFLFISMALGVCIETRFFPDSYKLEDPWKFGYGHAFLLVVVGITGWCYGKSRLMVIVLYLMAASVNLYLGSRSLALILFMGALLISSISIYPQVRKSFAISFYAYVGCIMAAFFLSLVGVSFLYGELAQKGVLGDMARAKFEYQNERGGGGVGAVLKSARSESLVSLPAILDKPLWGHGSSPNVDAYLDLGLDDLSDPLQRSEFNKRKESGVIPTHSHVFGAWVEAGVLGACFWFFAIICVVKCLRSVLYNLVPANVCICVISVSFMWNIFFSPFGVGARFYAAICFAVVLLELARPSRLLRHG